MGNIDGSTATCMSLAFFGINIVLLASSLCVPWQSVQNVGGLTLGGTMEIDFYLTEATFTAAGTFRKALDYVKTVVSGITEEEPNTNCLDRFMLRRPQGVAQYQMFMSQDSIMQSRAYNIPMRTLHGLLGALRSSQHFFPSIGVSADAAEWLYWTGVIALMFIILGILFQCLAAGHLYHYAYVKQSQKMRKTAGFLSCFGLGFPVLAAVIYSFNFMQGGSESVMPDFVSASSEPVASWGVLLFLPIAVFSIGICILMGHWSKNFDETVESYREEKRTRSAFRRVQKKDRRRRRYSSDSSSSSSVSSYSDSSSE